MLHPIHAQGTKANLLVRGAILALGVSLALCLWLIVAPSQEARAQGNTPPSVERDSPSSSSVSLETGDTQTFTATGTGEATYLTSWSFYADDVWKAGGSLDLELSYQGTISLRFGSTGSFTVKASFTDAANSTGSTTWRVTVTDPQSNEAPRITSTSPSRRITVEEDDRETFSFTATDDDNNINEWSYYVDGKLEGGQSLSPTGSISTSFSYRFTRDGVVDVELEVTDSDGETDDYEWEVTVEEENSEPQVNKVSPLSTPRLRPGDSETFEAEATDRDDNISQVEWTVDGRSVSGQSLSLTGSIDRSHTHVFPSAGTFDVEVEFTDQAGGSDSVSWTVYVETEDTNRPPTASHVSPFVSLALDIGDSQTFTASATDPDSNISQIQWFVNGQSVSGQSLSLTGSIERSHTHTFSGGTYEIEARVTDSDGLSDSVIWELSAGDPPVIGRLGCSPTRVEEGVSVSCTPQTRGGSVSTYQWGASGGIPPSGSSGAFSTHWNSSGTKRVSLRVCNSDGCDSEEQNITVVDSGDANTEERRFVPSPVQINQPPLVSPVSPLISVILDVGDSQTFTAKAKDADDNITSIEWLVNGVTEDRESFGRSSPVEKSFTYIATSAGHYEVRAVFTDSDGASGYMEWEFEAIDPKPQINGLGCAPVSLEVGESFACSPSLSGSAPARYNWTANGAVTTVGYSREFSAKWDTAGQKQIALEVCDAQGNCDSTTQTVTVLPPTPPPQIDSLGCYTPSLNIDWQLLCRPQLSGGPAVSFSWTARGAFPPGGRNETFAIRSWNAPGNREVSLEVCNRRGECETLSQSVTIGGTAQPPQIDSLGCTPGTVEVAEEVACTPSLSGGPAERFNWSAEDAAPWLGYGAEFSTRWNSPGRKVIELEVCDAEGLCDTGQQAISVEGAPGAPPVIHNLGCSASVVEVGEYITCNPEFSADGPVEYIWEATGGFPDYGDARGFRTRLAYAGTEVITLLLCADDECNYLVHNVEVVDEVTDNRPPIAIRVSPDSPVTVLVGERYTFVAQATDPDGDLRTVSWYVRTWLSPSAFGFSSVASSTQQFSHVFRSPGQYRVSASYYDSEGQSSVATWYVTAVEGAPIPEPALESFNESLLTLQEIKRDWLACTDENPDNETLCLSESEGAPLAGTAAANLSSIFDQYRDQGFGHVFIGFVQTILRHALLAKLEIVNAEAFILEGAACGQACLEMELPGSESPWYLMGWLIAGFVPGVDIFTDGRDVLVSVATCATGLLSLDGCDWLDLGINGLGFGSSFVPLGVGQVGNAPQAAKHVAKYAIKNPLETAKHLKVFSKVPGYEAGVDEIAVFTANRFIPSQKDKTEFVGVLMGEKAGLYREVKIKSTPGIFLKIRSSHISGGLDADGKSLFDNHVAFDSLIDEANLVHPRFQKASGKRPAELQWIVDAGERVGMARVARYGDSFATPIYTVITDLDGKVITAHPGIPSVKIGLKYDPSQVISGSN